MEKVYRNTAIFIVIIILGVQWGFYQTYTSQFPNFINKTNMIHIHGALLMMWMGLLVLQPLLIAYGKRQLHRTIGKVSWVLGPLVIITLFFIGRSSFLRSVGQFPEQENLATMVLDVRGFLSFAIFWALAMINRKNSSSHMRYMIATGILAIGPGVGRGLISIFGPEFFHPALTITDILDLVIVGALLVYDINKKNNYKPYLVVFTILLIGSILWQVKYTAAWQSFAKGYSSLFYL